MAIPSPRYVEPMTPSLSADNLSAMGTLGSMSSPPVKRKMDDEGISRVPNGTATAEGKENGAPVPEKRARTEKSAIPTAPCGNNSNQAEGSRNGHPAPNGTDQGLSSGGLVELKQRKLVFKQSSHNFDIPRRKKLEFEAFLLDVQDGKEKLGDELPEEYHAVIVLAGHEATSATEAHFVNHLKKVLDMKDLADVIPGPTWSNLISRLFSMRQYGFLHSDFPSTSTGTRKIPAGLQIRCWEAKEPERYFSEEQLQVVRARQEERARAREDVLGILKGLDDVEVLDLIKGEKEEKGRKEKKGRVSTVQDSPAPSIDRKSREGTAASGTSRRSASPVKKGKMTPEEEEAARIKQEEREAKKAAKEEKRIQKEEKEVAKQAEIQKKEALMAKQKQTMSSFFKPKPVVKPAMNSDPGPSKTTKIQVTDFDRSFKPVTFRPNVEWAPVNRFRYKRRSNSPESAGEEVDDWQPSDHIQHHIRKTGTGSSRTAERLPRGLKSAPLHGSVAEVWAECQDASDPRRVLNRLKNNRKFPWKTLAFDQQVRPPYSGTFTKRSVVVGPRTPFAQDPMFDYSYDSGDDWVDDEGGEDVDDNAGVEPEEQDEEDEESEGEFDDWLDDAEEEVMDVDENFVPPLLKDDEPVFVGSNGGEQSKLPMKAVKKRDVPPKKVVKVVPTWKGPLWETELGQGTEGMEVYRIQLLNDTPGSIDPFRYTSDESQPKYRATYTTVAIGSNLSVKTLLSVDLIDDPIHMPDTATLTTPSDPFAPAVPRPATEPSSTKPRPSGPKIAFPISHLPELLKLINGNKRIRSDLISQLRERFDSVTSKAAIEQKLREVAVREGKTKDSAWRVLPEAWSAAGVAPASVGDSGMIVDT